MFPSFNIFYICNCLTILIIYVLIQRIYYVIQIIWLCNIVIQLVLKVQLLSPNIASCCYMHNRKSLSLLPLLYLTNLLSSGNTIHDRHLNIEKRASYIFCLKSSTAFCPFSAISYENPAIPRSFPITC